MNRSKIRELAFELLYSLEIQKVEKESIEEQIKMFLETNEITDKKAEEYFTDVVYGIQTNSEKIQETISSNLASNWKIERISKISLVLLKLSTYELIYKKRLTSLDASPCSNSSENYVHFLSACCKSLRVVFMQIRLYVLFRVRS